MLNKKHLTQQTHLKKSTRVYDIEVSLKIQLDISQYVCDGTEYEFNTVPYIDSRYAGLIFHEYLYERHEHLTATKKRKGKEITYRKTFRTIRYESVKYRRIFFRQQRIEIQRYSVRTTNIGTSRTDGERFHSVQRND